ncbi:hypothetical protein [Geomonas oryzae]|uniref:hypothetical protein n=1 Tax=Geomonas oryzae TaxID=2364273 RepID=UPI00100A4C54|nr:hypothetical protein [Geomonas oryzae]
MKKTILALTIAAVIPFSAHAAEFKIHETETEIIVEYNGDAQGKSSSDKVVVTPVEVKPAPVQVAKAPSKANKEDDEEETKSVGKLARKQQELARAKARVARAALNAKKNRDLSTTDPNDYYQPQSTPE